jgi:hypothetical protein
VAGFWAFLWYFWRNRIDFAAALLSAVAGLTQKYPATITLSYASLAAQLVWNTFWIVTVVLLLRMQNTPGYAVSVFLIFSFYWVSQVLQNIVHVSCSGTFATWYFLSNNMPANPTAKALRRALTYSFGSICLGSLLVALIKTIRAIVRSLRNSRFALLACLIDCILSCLDGLLQYFNKYAFVYVAIYGSTFWTAAKQTFQMFKDTGFMAIVNDSITGTVFGMSSFIGAILAAILGALISLIWVDSIILVIIISFFIGYTMIFQVMQTLESGVATIFVAFAEDPHALQRNDPQLYNRFISTYGGQLKFR